MKTAIALLSGGLDSVTSLALARRDHSISIAITFNYGQRALERELSASKYFCNLWQIPHKIMPIPWLKEVTTTVLVNKDADLSSKSVNAVWVPNRNGLFINIAAVYCDALNFDAIITGFNAEEAEEFPDNSSDFITAINKTLEFSTLKKPSVLSPTQAMKKDEILTTAIKLKIPLDKLWPCYEGGEKFCGLCKSCNNTVTALKKVGLWEQYKGLFT